MRPRKRDSKQFKATKQFIMGKLMVRDAEKRTKKYERGIHPERLGRTLEAVKPIMVDQEKVYLPQITLVEQKVKALCEAQGISTIQIAQYINFGRQLYSKAKRFSQATLSAEAQYLTDFWTSRGLRGSKLVEIAKLFGVTPTAPALPTAYYPLGYWLPLNEWIIPPSTSLQPRIGTATWANMLEFDVFQIMRKVRLNAMAINITLGVPDVYGHIGIYNSENHYPKNLLVTSPELDFSITGLKTVDIDLTLDPSINFHCLNANLDGAGLTEVVCRAQLVKPTPTLSPASSYFTEMPYGDLPDPAPEGMIADVYSFEFWIRVAELL